MKKNILDRTLVKKTFGIGAISLLLFIAILVPSTEATITHQQNIDEITFAEIGTLLKRYLPTYENDIDEIMEYLEQYYTDNGIFDEEFMFPEHLKVKLDEIINEIVIQQNNYYVEMKRGKQQIYEDEILATSGGGINKVTGPHNYFIWWDWGIYYRVWLDDDTTNNLGYGNLAAMLLTKFGPVGFIIAIIIAGSIIYIQNANKGNGVLFDARISYNPAVPRFYVANAKSQ
jgi:hypothetical protein